MYSVDKWESTNRSSTSPKLKYPARIKNLDKSHRLDRWETADQPKMAVRMADPLEVAIEGLERLLVDYHVEPEVITVTRHAPFSVDALTDAIDVEAEFVDSAEQGIRK
ncbi:hypothetical protein [Haloarcula sp. Atlit-7R]|uniref:hypothetical protein n=1 Tax=Haloarcula sp. Atlit-7R TaxID=2282125 RepID=UPI0011C49034|nr:hypothetical protein [Haloarcula sp. Atlit-7R]